MTLINLLLFHLYCVCYRHMNKIF